MVCCCAYTSIVWGCCKWSSPDVLFLGDSGVDGWAACVVGDGCTCGCPDACVNATGNAAWQDITSQLKGRGLTWSHMGMNSAPVSELCCVAPLLLLKNKPKKYIVAQMGANDLVWYPGMVLQPCMDYPMCSFDLFMGHVDKYGQPGLKVIYAPDQVSPRAGCSCFPNFYGKIEASAGTVVKVEVPADALSSAEAADAFIKHPTFTYSTTTNAKAKHANLVYLDCISAYDELIKAKGNSKKWISTGMEMTLPVYMHYNMWIMHIVGGGDEAPAASAPAASAPVMVRD